MGEACDLDVELTTYEVREEWHKFLQDNKDALTFHSKPLASVSLGSSSFSKKPPFLKLIVKWDLFVEYLEEKAMGFLSELEENGDNIIRVYGEIWTNLFYITGEITPVDPTYSLPAMRERFRKLLMRTGDYRYIGNLLDQLEGMIKPVQITEDEIPSIKLYTTNLIMDVQHLRALIDVINIPAAYLLLRNLLENFVKLFVYLDIVRSPDIDTDLFLSLMFLYEYELARKSDQKKRRMYSLKRFRNESIKKFLKIVSANSPNESPELLEKQIPTLGINPRVLEDFSENHGLNEVNLKSLYASCSMVIHNQPPLPFFSLLEVKFFKHFLEKYMRSLQVVIEKLIDEKIELERIHIHPLLGEDRQYLKKCLKVAYLLERDYDAEMKDMTKSALTTLQKERDDTGWIKPLTLTSIFYLISPSLRHLRGLSFIDGDLEDIVEKLSPASFKISIRNEVFETLNEFQEMMLLELENYEVFSSIKPLEQKKEVIFYLLLHYLPEIAEENMKS